MTTNITARSLVGMTMGARKRRWAKDYDAMPRSGRASKTVSMLRAYGVYPKDGNPLAQRLRPCPGCFDCAVECWVCHEPHEPPDELCRGSGVIRAGKLRPLLRKPDCGFYVD